MVFSEVWQNTDTSPGHRGESYSTTPFRFPWKTQLGLKRLLLRMYALLIKHLVPHVDAQKHINLGSLGDAIETVV